MRPRLFIAAVLLVTGFAGPALSFGGLSVEAIEAIETIETGDGQIRKVAGQSLLLDAEGRIIVLRQGRGFRASPRFIFRSLRAQKFHSFSVMHIRRGKYSVKARDAYGRRVRLVIDPYSGEIVRIRYLH